MIATCSSPPAAASACTARRSTSRPSWQAKPSESKRSTTAFGSSASCTTIWDISTSNRGPCSPSTTPDRKSTRLNSSHVEISYAVFCLKKKKKKKKKNIYKKKKKKKKNHTKTIKTN